MAKTKKQSPSDPAEIARRKLPRGSEVNVHGLTLAANQDVVIEEATRDKVARVQRYDCFALLHSRGAIEAGQLVAVRRLQDDIATRFRVDSSAPTPVAVDMSGSSDLVSARSLDAARRLAAVLARTGKMSADLLIQLSEPQVVEGRQVNWKATVKRVTGETHPVGQGAWIRAASENLRLAYVEIDNGVQKAA